MENAMLKLKSLNFYKFLLITIMFFVIIIWDALTIRINIDLTSNENVIYETLVKKSIKQFNIYKTDSVPEKIKDLLWEIYLEENNSRVSFDLLLRIGYIESNFNVYCVSLHPSGESYDLGLFQINSKYLEFFKQKYNFEDTFNPLNIKDSARFAIKHLSYLIDYYKGDIVKAVMAYNCGVSAVDRKKIPQTTVDYVAKILYY